MLEEDDAPDATGNEPIGMAAAAAKWQAAAQAAQAADSSSPSAGTPLVQSAAAPSSEGDNWRFKVEMALAYLDGWMEGWCPTWKPPSGLAREEGIQGWCELLVLLKVPKIHPGYTVAGFMLACYGPPLYVGWKARQKLAADARAAQG